MLLFQTCNFFAHVLFHCHGQWFGIFITVASLWHSMVPYDSDCVSPVICNDHMRTCHITRPSVAAFVLSPPSLVRRSLSLSRTATRGYSHAIEFICPIHRNPSPSAIRIIEFIPADFSSTSGTLFLLLLSLLLRELPLNSYIGHRHRIHNHHHQ